ncbi:uncharacterized protein BP5553_05273 [Venustampulla echinocandica]|uniref:Uncharacterized protein n=1 Tax=Venustampulla echinocandica TaxID=2656787 RepID=A0A370TQP0_9HELO|nr:uncharacterized protein BP5553_05273 [Venustampulla echinocandica]RDL37840.1 hypothetical protein BP5553_05273 [Venustampulla echinocandica]
MAHIEEHSEELAQSWAWLMDIMGVGPQGEGNYASAASSPVQDIVDHGLTLPPSDRSGLGAEDSNATQPSGPCGTDTGALREASLTYLLSQNDYQSSETPEEIPGLTGKVSSDALPHYSPSIEAEASVRFSALTSSGAKAIDQTRESPATTWSASCQCQSDNSHRMRISGSHQSTVWSANSSREDIQLRIRTEELPRGQAPNRQVWSVESNVPLSSEKHYCAGLEVSNPAANCIERPVVDETHNSQSIGRPTTLAQPQIGDALSDIPLPSIERDPPRKLQSMFLPAMEASGGVGRPKKKMGIKKTLEFGIPSGLFPLNHVHPAEVDSERGYPPLETHEINSREPRISIVDGSIPEPQALITNLPLPLAICVAVSEPLLQLNTLGAIIDLQALLNDTGAQQPQIPAQLRTIFDQLFTRWKADDQYRTQLLFLIMEKLEESKSKSSMLGLRRSIANSASEGTRLSRSLGPNKREQESILEILATLDNEHTKLRSKDRATMSSSDKCLVSAMGQRNLLKRCEKAFKDLERASDALRSYKALEKKLDQQAQVIERYELDNKRLNKECHNIRNDSSTYQEIAQSTPPTRELTIPAGLQVQRGRAYKFGDYVTNPFWLCLLPDKVAPHGPCRGVNRDWHHYRADQRNPNPQGVWVNRVKCSNCLHSNESRHLRQYISDDEAEKMPPNRSKSSSRSLSTPEQTVLPDAPLGVIGSGASPHQASASATTSQHLQHPPQISCMPLQSPLLPATAQQSTDAISMPPPNRECWPKPAPGAGYWQLSIPPSHPIPHSSANPVTNPFEPVQQTPSSPVYSSPYPQYETTETMNNIPISYSSPYPQYGTTETMNNTPISYSSPYPQHGIAETMNNAPISYPSLGYQGDRIVRSQPKPAATKFRTRGADPGVLTLPTVPQTVINQAGNMLSNSCNSAVASVSHNRPDPGGVHHTSLQPAQNHVNRAAVSGSHKRPAPGGEHYTIQPMKRPKKIKNLGISLSTTDAVRVALPGIKRSWMPQDHDTISKSKEAQGESIAINDDDANPVNPAEHPAILDDGDVSSLFDCDEAHVSESTPSNYDELATSRPSTGESEPDLELDMEAEMAAIMGSEYPLARDDSLWGDEPTPRIELDVQPLAYAWEDEESEEE